jgi:predicted dehydrogenase
MSVESKSRIVVYGAGAMGGNHARAVAQHPNCELAGIIDVDADRAGALARTYGAMAFPSLNDARAAGRVDGAVVATTTASHFDVCTNLVGEGVPFLVEKPITDSLETTVKLLELSKQANLVMSCGFVERFNPAVQTALQMMDEPMKHMLSVRHSPFNPRATASVIYDLLIHDIDLALAFAARNNPTSDIAGGRWYPSPSSVDEIADCVLKFESGAVASLSASRQGQRKIREIRVTTETHLFEIDLLRSNVTVYRNVMQEVVQSTGATTYRAETIVDIPFVRHQGEPLAQQIGNFHGLLTGQIDADAERESLLASHIIAAKLVARR